MRLRYISIEHVNCFPLVDGLNEGDEAVSME